MRPVRKGGALTPASMKELMLSIYTIPSIPVCRRLPDGQGQAGIIRQWHYCG